MCDDGWDLSDADVVCKQLGYTGARHYTFEAFYRQGNGTIWMDDVACILWNSRLGYCNFSGWDNHSCDHSEDVGVICTKATITEMLFVSVILSSERRDF